MDNSRHHHIPPIVPVKSSSLNGYGYDAIAQELVVRFKENGPIYVYRDVPPELFERFQKAESFGRFFATEIKGKFGEPTKIEPVKEEDQ